MANPIEFTKLPRKTELSGDEELFIVDGGDSKRSDVDSIADRALDRFTGATGTKGEPGATGPAGTAGPPGGAGPPGPAGTTGPPGEKGIPGTAALKGSKGDGGVKGEPGATGPAGATGPSGAKGDASTTAGPPGEKGAPGDAGAKGARGSAGAKGSAGNQGAKGAQGDAGEKGAKGAAGADSTVAGPPGPAGTPGVKGTAGEKGIPGTAAEKGSKGDPGVKGEVGPTGPKGNVGDVTAKGVKGDEGPTGPAGPQGTPGSAASKGDTGSIGPKGGKGDQGEKGEMGQKGQKGQKGVKGIQGDTGPKGNTGDVEAKGNKGQKGEQAEKGAPGEKGTIGAVGGLGAKGEPGEKGNTGATGAAGAKGDASTVAGPTGPQGPAGPAGTPGSAAAKGDPGPAGAAGAQGPPGSAGSTGQAGPPGGIGPPGSAGPPGPQGPAGPEGAKGEVGDGPQLFQFINQIIRGKPSSGGTEDPVNNYIYVEVTGTNIPTIWVPNTLAGNFVNEIAVGNLINIDQNPTSENRVARYTKISGISTETLTGPNNSIQAQRYNLTQLGFSIGDIPDAWEEQDGLQRVDITFNLPPIGAMGPKGALGPAGPMSTVPGPKGEEGCAGPPGGPGPPGPSGGEKGQKGAPGPSGGQKGQKGEEGPTGNKGDAGGNKGEPGEKGQKGDAPSAGNILGRHIATFNLKAGAQTSGNQVPTANPLTAAGQAGGYNQDLPSGGINTRVSLGSFPFTRTNKLPDNLLGFAYISKNGGTIVDKVYTTLGPLTTHFQESDLFVAPSVWVEAAYSAGNPDSDVIAIRQGSGTIPANISVEVHELISEGAEGAKGSKGEPGGGGGPVGERLFSFPVSGTLPSANTVINFAASLSSYATGKGFTRYNQGGTNNGVRTNDLFSATNQVGWLVRTYEGSTIRDEKYITTESSNTTIQFGVSGSALTFRSNASGGGSTLNSKTEFHLLSATNTSPTVLANSEVRVFEWIGGIGQKGTAGSTGPAGAAGPAGQKGAKGDDGPPGGPPGPPGPAGGPPGPPGQDGQKGDRGSTGLAGNIGQKGAKGDVGPRGEKGFKGDPDGEKGEKGAPGPIGPGGGDKGEPGQKGDPGGQKGQKGEGGPPGGAGPAGPSGEKGDPGEKGQKGAGGGITVTGTPKEDDVIRRKGSNWVPESGAVFQKDLYHDAFFGAYEAFISGLNPWDGGANDDVRGSFTITNRTGTEPDFGAANRIALNSISTSGTQCRLILAANMFENGEDYRSVPATEFSTTAAITAFDPGNPNTYLTVSAIGTVSTKFTGNAQWRWADVTLTRTGTFVGNPIMVFAEPSTLKAIWATTDIYDFTNKVRQALNDKAIVDLVGGTRTDTRDFLKTDSSGNLEYGDPLESILYTDVDRTFEFSIVPPNTYGSNPDQNGGEWGLTTDASGPPTVANTVQSWASITNGDYTLFQRIVDREDVATTDTQFANFTDATAQDGGPNNGFTLSGFGTVAQVGTMDNRRVRYARVTVTLKQSALTGIGGYTRFHAVVPSQRNDYRIPVGNVSGASALKGAKGDAGSAGMKGQKGEAGAGGANVTWTGIWVNASNQPTNPAADRRTSAGTTWGVTYSATPIGGSGHSRVFYSIPIVSGTKRLLGLQVRYRVGSSGTIWEVFLPITVGGGLLDDITYGHTPVAALLTLQSDNTISVRASHDNNTNNIFTMNTAEIRGVVVGA